MGQVYIKIYIICRQIDPVQNKALADSQSKETQIENLRVVKVNAQVTAMISFSEIVGFILISVISVIAKSATIGDILFPVLQNIILPYAFLMNTRENKYRIVEQGWKNVLRNFLNINYLCPVCSRSSNVEPFHDNQNNEDADIYIISRKVQQKALIANNPPLECNINVPVNNHPSTSCNIIQMESNGEGDQNPACPSLSSSGESLDVIKPILKNREEFLDKLLINRNEEVVYISIFMQLIQFEKDHTLEIEDLEENMNTREDIVTNTVSKLLIRGNRQRRMDMRQDMLKRLQNCINEEDEYQETFDAFLNMEESFLEESG